MLSADTNLFLHAADPDSSSHSAARAFFEEIASSGEEFVICELVLVELYMLLRNPALLVKPYSARESAGYCRALKQNPAWRSIDYDPAVASKLWAWAASTKAGYRQIIDARLALTLRHHGVTAFATANTKHFKEFGFAKIWNPLSDPS